MSLMFADPTDDESIFETNINNTSLKAISYFLLVLTLFQVFEI